MLELRILWFIVFTRLKSEYEKEDQPGVKSNFREFLEDAISVAVEIAKFEYQTGGGDGVNKFRH
jgi:hypothetical protein